MAFTPQLRAPQAVSSSYLFYNSLHWLNWLLPSQLIQKLLLFGILVLAGWGMHRLVRLIDSRLPLAALLMAGTLYMVNPFVYDRFMTGQFAVLFGYALLPWFVASLLSLLRQPRLTQPLRLAGWALAISIVSIHSIGIMLMLGSLILVLYLWRLRGDRAACGLVMRYVAFATSVWLLASSYWLIPALLGQDSTIQSIGAFTAGDRQAFATIGGSIAERLGNVLSLQGFWAEGRGLYILPQQAVPLWALLMLGLLVLVVLGAVCLWRRQRGTAVIMLACIIIGAVLAAGIGSEWMVRFVPFFAGYREPQKFVMLIAFAYAVLAAYGVAACIAKLRPRYNWAGQGGVIFCALPFLLTPTLLWAANGQLRAVDYPAGWYTANRILASDSGNFQTLFLPWHLYINANFAAQASGRAGTIIANPAANFFDTSIISSDDPELPGVALTEPVVTKRPVGRQIASLLAAAPNSDAVLGRQLADLHVKYILLAKTSDYTRYGYLDRQTNLQLVGDYDGMRLYRNQAYQVQ